MLEAWRWVEALGVRIVDGNLGELNGAYLHDHRTILMDLNLAPVQYHSTLMHELGHAFHDHDRTTPRNEWEASQWVARALIRGCEYEALIKVFECPQSIAFEMGVLPRDVVNYQQWRETVVRSPGWSESAENSC
ncbi:ImmA/IrrE family metallo-endopeptidase [Arthrobacter roseus]|uniref:ImmA/IrrE family metallo-endopeptidase n=1 Tax=Arthrobacter roseus TaxID=136274 RepID=UPI0019637119|nr:ImmA/IrrE family metallo-endopeptidase [Arthrobacter roseus]MBM7847513.1 hypothetical protein [Arthrobacter roseus]